MTMRVKIGWAREVRVMMRAVVAPADGIALHEAARAIHAVRPKMTGMMAVAAVHMVDVGAPLALRVATGMTSAAAVAVRPIARVIARCVVDVPLRATKGMAHCVGVVALAIPAPRAVRHRAEVSGAMKISAHEGVPEWAVCATLARRVILARRVASGVPRTLQNQRRDSSPLPGAWESLPACSGWVSRWHSPIS